jgi:hypothetical protein
MNDQIKPKESPKKANKKPYQAPAILSRQSLETVAALCAKIDGEETCLSGSFTS